MDLTQQFLVLIPVVVGLVQVIKLTGLDTRWSPMVSIVLGVLGVGLLGGFGGIQTLQGIVVGLSAAGLYSGTGATLASGPVTVMAPPVS